MHRGVSALDHFPIYIVTGIGCRRHAAMLWWSILIQLSVRAFRRRDTPQYAARSSRRRSAPPKLVTLSNALLAVVDPQGIPSSASDPTRFGAWVENACLAHAWICGQRVSYRREEPYEVDGVIEGTWDSWAIEIKTGTFKVADLQGLFEFTRRHPSYRPLLVCDTAALPTAERAGVEVVTWRQFLIAGLPGAMRPS
jgi:hypothetical protein